MLDRRYRTRDGEIDLVALDGTTVVFVEVKTRCADALGGRPAEAVTRRKRAVLARTALHYLQDRDWLDRPARFDVVEVLRGPRDDLRILHLVDAFRPDPGAF